MTSPENFAGFCLIHKCPTHACPSDCPNKGGKKGATSGVKEVTTAARPKKMRYATEFDNFTDKSAAEKFSAEVNNFNLNKTADVLKDCDSKIRKGVKYGELDFLKDDVFKALRGVSGNNPTRSDIEFALAAVSKILSAQDDHHDAFEQAKLIANYQHLDLARHFLQRQLDKMPQAKVAASEKSNDKETENPDAGEKFKELQKRYGFLKSYLEDKLGMSFNGYSWGINSLKLGGAEDTKRWDALVSGLQNIYKAFYGDPRLRHDKADEYEAQVKQLFESLRPVGK